MIVRETIMDYLNDKERKGINRFVELIKELLGENLVLMKLFGSKVRGDSNEESDIDILLVLKEKEVLILQQFFLED
jgi:predicted nucleotidyltransferase